MVFKRFMIQDTALQTVYNPIKIHQWPAIGVIWPPMSVCSRLLQLLQHLQTRDSLSPLPFTFQFIPLEWSNHFPSVKYHWSKKSKSFTETNLAILPPLEVPVDLFSRSSNYSYSQMCSQEKIDWTNCDICLKPEAYFFPSKQSGAFVAHS